MQVIFDFVDMCDERTFQVLFVCHTLFTSMFGRLNDFRKWSISLKSESECVWIAKALSWRHFGRSSVDFGVVSSLWGPAWELGRSWMRRWTAMEISKSVGVLVVGFWARHGAPRLTLE